MYVLLQLITMLATTIMLYIKFNVVDKVFNKNNEDENEVNIELREHNKKDTSDFKKISYDNSNTVNNSNSNNNSNSKITSNSKVNSKISSIVVKPYYGSEEETTSDVVIEESSIKKKYGETYGKLVLNNTEFITSDDRMLIPKTSGKHKYNFIYFHKADVLICIDLDGGTDDKVKSTIVKIRNGFAIESKTRMYAPTICPVEEYYLLYKRINDTENIKIYGLYLLIKKVLKAIISKTGIIIFTDEKGNLYRPIIQDSRHKSFINKETEVLYFIKEFVDNKFLIKILDIEY